MLRSAKAAWMAGALVLTGMAAAPAMAEVKAGVDAWTAGDFATAVREWAGPAAEGDPDAQFNMGQAYRLGRGVETDVAQAEALYARAAAQGHVKAADNYGLLLFQRGAREEALPYISAAAMRGDPSRFQLPRPMLDRPACPECGERALRPDVVWFGEMPYEMDRIHTALRQADLFVSIGTSGAVYPAAGFVQEARAMRVRTLELNLEASQGSRWFHETRQGPASQLVPQWVDEVLGG